MSLNLDFEEGASDCELFCTITDQHRCLPENALNYLTQPFGILSDGPENLSLKSNLDYAIIRRMTDVLGGSVQLLSSIETGTCYTLAVPLKCSGQPKPDTFFLDNSKLIGDRSPLELCSLSKL